MIVEVIAVGTELLLGEIVNTNAAEIGTRLAEDGFDLHRQVIVGDNLDRLVDAIMTACGRADAVLLTGGIGPTPDDQTRDAICAVLGVAVVTDHEHAEVIRARLAERGVEAHTALRMADYPAGAEPLPNREGVALGIAARFDGTLIFAVPGVPSEMRVMVDEQVRPRLRAHSGESSVLSSRILHCWGLGESQVAEKLDDLYASNNPSLAFLINGPEVRVRITAKAANETDASAMIARVESRVRELLGSHVFGVDDETVDELVADGLARRGWSIASIEVATGGLFAQRLTRLSAFVAGSVVPVAPPAKDAERSAAILLSQFDQPEVDVLLAVGAMSGDATGGGMASQYVGVAVRTPDGITTHTIRTIGSQAGAATSAATGALHLLRQALAE